MSTKNLTRDEARHRSENIAVHRYHVTLDIRQATDPHTSRFRSTTKVRFKSQVTETFLDLLDAEVESVLINDQPVPVEYDGARVMLRGLNRGKNVVQVAASLPYSHSGRGLHRFVDPADGNTYLYTHFEPADSRHAYAVFEQPDLKAHFDVDVIAPENWRVIGNQVHDDSETLDDDSVLHDFRLTPRMASYLTAIAAGPYVRRTSSWTSSDGAETIELGLLCRASMEQYLDDQDIFHITRKGLEFYHRAFHYPYPWGKYDQIFVPEYNLGAMENPGCVTFTERYLFREKPTRAQLSQRANTILHEMAHMWFGDLVTPKWWNDNWLKESFAEYMGAHASQAATEFTDAWVSFAVGRKAWAYTADQLSTTHPISADITDLDAASQNFDGITYAKGASVLKQLVHHVGVEKFFAGARSYFRELAFDSATLEDLLHHLERASGRSLGDWSDAWLRTSGLDTVLPELHVDDGRITDLTIVRDSVDARTGQPANRPHTLAVGLYNLNDDVLTRSELVEVDITSPRTPVKAVTGHRVPDLVLINDEDFSYAKVRLDEDGTDVALDHLSDLDEPLTRALLWSVLWNAVRDAKLSVDSYLKAVASHAGKETDPAILGQVLGQARQAVANYLPQQAVPHARHELAELAWRELDAAEVGSDVQIVWARHALVVAAGDPASAARVRAMIDGSTLPEGLEMGPDLRWDGWIALAAVGQASEGELDAELDRDHTKNGVNSHLCAMTARRDNGYVRDMWRRLMTPGELTNEHVDAVIAGLRKPLSADLFHELDSGYFDDLQRIWEQFPIEMATRLVVGLFPSDEPETNAEQAQQWLQNHPDAPGGLTRLVRERRDLAANAATARAFNAACSS